MSARVSKVFCWLCALSVGMSPRSAGQARIDEKTRQEIEAVRAVANIATARPGTEAPPLALTQVGKSNEGGFAKSLGEKDRKTFLMNGNKITTTISNYGGIGPGYGVIRGVNNMVWRNLDYVFQFCPIVGASVPDARNPQKRIHIISDALWDYPGLREVNPTGDTLWQWQPLPGYADPDQPNMASYPAVDKNGDGKPDSWPRAWYNPTLGKYVWPGYLSQDATSSDLECYWAMDDRSNSEFQYYPFASDSGRRGIGLQVDGRAFQWSNALAANTIFFVYTVSNISEKDLDSTFFGVYGDPDLGGASPENQDDRGFFIPPYYPPGGRKGLDSITFVRTPVYSRSLVYFYDYDGKGARGLALGYLGCKYLESPSNTDNAIDDDGDGLINERQDDGIDNDKDWSVLTDDVGVDGIPNTDDQGEGNGVPTAGLRLPGGALDPLHPGEPNFELTDLDESDQIGLTSFNSWTWNNDKITNDESMWNRCIPGNFGEIEDFRDIVFIFASGYISLKKGETKRVSSALVLGENLDDLVTAAKTVQTIYNQNYRFFKPPAIPHMTAVPGDKKVSLYWDTKAEESTDPITGKDFEGYVIYRSLDPGFGDIETITDGKGSQFLTTPLKDASGFECKWDVAQRDEPYTDVNLNGKYDPGEPYVDVTKDGNYSVGYNDIWKGYHPIPYQDRGIQYYLGNNRGLVHSYVDSNQVINGQTYYYAVVSYDHGDSIGISPTECTKKITVDPITSQLTFDVNTAQVIPGPRASGYEYPVIGAQNVQHVAGIGTGPVKFEILSDLQIPQGGKFTLAFADSLPYVNKNIPGKNYSVMDEKVYTETVQFFDTNFVALDHQNVADDAELKVSDKAGTVYIRNQDYVMNLTRGTLRRTVQSAIPPTGTADVSYHYYPVSKSQSLAGGDENPVFNGIRVKVTDVAALAYDPGRSAWLPGSRSNLDYLAKQPPFQRRRFWPSDYDIIWSATDIDTAVCLDPVGGGVIRTPVRYKVNDVTSGVPQRIQTFLFEATATKNKVWDPGDEIVLFKPGAAGAVTDTMTWSVLITRPADTTKTPILPTTGDVLRISTMRPFTIEDKFQLSTEAGMISTAAASGRLDRVYVVPNPYVGYNLIEPTNKLPGETRGERRIYFENLPPQCTIRIFTINGDLVTVLHHDAGVENAREFWNLLNRDGFGVAYGVYIAHIDAPGIGEKILKFALIK